MALSLGAVALSEGLVIFHFCMSRTLQTYSREEILWPTLFAIFYGRLFIFYGKRKGTSGRAAEQIGRYYSSSVT